LNAGAEARRSRILSLSPWGSKRFSPVARRAALVCYPQMLMKALYVLLALSIVAIMAAVAAMVWRLRWHLQRPHITPPSPVMEVVSEQEPVEKA
jgi:hypothetical protein